MWTARPSVLLGVLLLPSLTLGQAAAPATDGAAVAPVQGNVPSPAPEAAAPQQAPPQGAAPQGAAATPQDARDGSRATTAAGEQPRQADPGASADEGRDTTRSDLALESANRDRAQLRQQLDALQSEVAALSAELEASREQSARAQEDLLRLQEQQAEEERRARESSAAVQQSAAELERAQRQLATGSGAEAELQRAQAALSSADPSSPRGVHAGEASRLVAAAMDAMRRDSLYEARVLLEQAQLQARAARAAPPYGR